MIEYVYPTYTAPSLTRGPRSDPTIQGCALFLLVSEGEEGLRADGSKSVSIDTVVTSVSAYHSYPCLAR